MIRLPINYANISFTKIKVYLELMVLLVRLDSLVRKVTQV
jgi:hypothetical protein